MNANPLHVARLVRWSQNGEARLTPEAAAEWLNDAGLARWLPDEASGAAPAPSFLEAVVGRPAPAPSAAEQRRAGELLAQLIETSAAAPLKFSPRPGERPGWIVGPEALRYVYALRGNRNVKGSPMDASGNATPLAQHVWQAIAEQGPRTAPALQATVGGDVTETAMARALDTLWTELYIFPLFHGGNEPVEWESLSRRFPEPLAAGSCTGHAEAQSALVSLYLHAAAAATEEEVLSFLAPLAPQSKLREVVHHLTSMRQLDLVDFGGEAQLCLHGEVWPHSEPQPARPGPPTRNFAAQNRAPGFGAGPRQETVPGAREPFSRPPKRPATSEPRAGDARPRKFPPKRFDRQGPGRQNSDRQDSDRRNPARQNPARQDSVRQNPDRRTARGPSQSFPPPSRSSRPWEKKKSAWEKKKPYSGAHRSDDRERRPRYDRPPRRDDTSDRRAGRPGFPGRPAAGGAERSRTSGPAGSRDSRSGAKRWASDGAARKGNRQGRDNSRRPPKDAEKRGDSIQKQEHVPFWARNPRDRKGPPGKRSQGKRSPDKRSSGGFRGKRPPGHPVKKKTDGKKK